MSKPKSLKLWLNKDTKLKREKTEEPQCWKRKTRNKKVSLMESNYGQYGGVGVGKRW